MGPRSIREHSLRFAATDLGMYDPETGRTYLAHEMANKTIADVGDVDVWPTDVKSTFDNATDLTRRSSPPERCRWCSAATTPSRIRS